MRDNTPAARRPAEPSESASQAGCGASPDALPVVDEEAFEALVTALGDRHAVESVLRMYLADLPVFIETIRSVTPESQDEARAAVHRLKGNAGMLGALALSDACRRFETAIKEQMVDTISELSAGIIEASDAVRDWVRERLGDEG